MCGIAGIIDTSAGADWLEDRVRRMQETLRHRGPDDRGMFASPQGIAAFAHTRLSIIDLSEAGHQPMHSACGRYTIVFNGEIYNYESLRNGLARGGAQFRTGTDTEVLLQLFIRDGEKCVHSLRGMFAFAIWDETEKSCFLARDPLGIKQLYYCESGNRFAFASEIRALVKAGAAEATANPLAIYGYLRTGSIPEPLTPIRNVRQLEAGSSASWKDGRLRQSSFWSPQPHFQSDDGSAGIEGAIERTRAALIDSIRHHFVSDVPVGIFLSGGIDSTALLALSRAVTGNHLSTFSIRVDDPALNEGDDARRIAEHFHSDHAELHLDARRVRDWIGGFLAAMDLPSIDGFNTYCVSRFASENGAKVVLSGLGGDELFGGYSSFSRIPRMLRIAGRLGPLRRPAGFALGAASSILPIHQAGRIAEFLSGPGAESDAFLAMRGIFTHREALRVLDTCGAGVDAEAALHFFAGSPPGREKEDATSLPDRISLLEMTRYMRNQLLRDSDVMSMASGLELRVPLVDQVLFETLATIPARLRIQPGKKLLTAAVPEIPRWILEKPKRGFTLPFADWLQGPLEELTQSLPRAPLPGLDQWYRKWALVALQNWQRNLGVSGLW